MTSLRSDIAGILAQAERILLLTHVYPDGDALGAQLAMYHALTGMGRQVYCFGEETVSHLYDFLPGSEAVRTELPDLQTFECALAMDCGDELRLGRHHEALLQVRPFLVVDHHQGHKPFGDRQWVEPKRASTGEMIYDLLQEMGAELSYETAYCLYTAIVSDTGSFKYSSTSAETFRVARELLAKGVKPAEVSGKLFDNFTVNRLHLLTAVLETLALYAEQRISMITVTRSMFDRTETTQEDTENFINYPRSLASVQVAVFLKETRDGKISASLRSKGSQIDVARVAAGFGGGGHRNAAGFKLSGTTLDETRGRLLKILVPLVEAANT